MLESHNIQPTNDSALAAPYDENYFAPYKDDPVRRQVMTAEYQRIVALRPKGGKVLDVGCGDGLFLSFFEPKLWERYGIDISPYACDQARGRGISVKDYAHGYDYPERSFDLITFRGSIQHLDTPFLAIKRCAAMLKPGGMMAFLQTPNANSICYRLFKTLPFLDPKLNFYIPSDTTLPNALSNFGLQTIKINYPYLDTPYARPIRDLGRFAMRCLGVQVKFPFWGNAIEVFAEKPEVRI